MEEEMNKVETDGDDGSYDDDTKFPGTALTFPEMQSTCCRPAIIHNFTSICLVQVQLQNNSAQFGIKQQNYLVLVDTEEKDVLQTKLMSNSEENPPEDGNLPTATATNHDDENPLTDSKIESSNAKQDKRKLGSTVEEYKWGKKHESQAKDLTKGIESDTGSNIIGDICRICHMGSFPPLSGNLPLWEWRTQSSRPIENQVSNISNFAYLGPLISACKCRGTVGLVHVECLERWLTESGHSWCELCGHRFATKRVPRHSIYRSIIIWFNTVFATRQMLVDVLYLAATTPLALFSIYICALAVKLILQSGAYEIPWMVIAMLPTCSLTLVAYWGWLITLGRYITRFHSRRWRRFWRNNFIVRLIPENLQADVVTANSLPFPEHEEQNELDQWQDENLGNFFNMI